MFGIFAPPSQQRLVARIEGLIEDVDQLLKHRRSGSTPQQLWALHDAISALAAAKHLLTKEEGK